jgi:hypothetical protein
MEEHCKVWLRRWSVVRVLTEFEPKIGWYLVHRTRVKQAFSHALKLVEYSI